MKKIFFFLAAMALAITANAKVTTISPDADNDALRLAVHYAEDGDVIEMTEGTYVQCNNGYVAFDGKSVTVKAAEGANVVLQLQVPITITNGGKATLQGIKIDASRLTELADWYEHIIYPTDATEGKELVMDGCEVYGFNYNKSAIYSSSSNTLALCDVKDCYFHDNEKSCLFFEGESIAELSVTNSTFANIIAKVTDSYYAGIIDVRSAAAKVTVDHCTFYNCLLMNTDYAAVTMKGPQAANVVISNNIFMLPEAIDGHRAIRNDVEATNCMTFNYVKDNGGIHSSVTKTNCQLNVDPKFVDAANGNFALAAGSPALGAGTDGSNLGDPRWNAPAVEKVTVTLFDNTGGFEPLTSGGGEYEAGASVTVTASEDLADWVFLGWTEDGEFVAYDAEYTFVVDGDVELVAVYAMNLGQMNSTDLVIDDDNMLLTASLANFPLGTLKLELKLGEYDEDEEAYTLTEESKLSVGETNFTFFDGMAAVDMESKSAKAIVVFGFEGMYFHVIVNMSAAPAKATDLVVTDATIFEDNGILFLTAPWEGKTIKAELPDTEHQGWMMIEIHEGEDFNIVMSQNATIATVDNVLTITGVFTDNLTGAVYNVNISGKLPVAEEPAPLKGIVKRALTIGESTIVLTHEADGTAHIYNIKGEKITELSQEGIIAVDPENAGDLLAISDIAATEDGKLVAINYMVTQSDSTRVDAGYKRGETRVYLWNDIAADPALLFTSKMSSNWFRAKHGLTMAVKGTADNMEIFTTGIHATSAWARVSSFRVINGVYEEPAVNHNDHYFFYDIADAIALETTVGTQYELNASPLGEMNWILDAELINPVEIVESAANNVEIATSVALTTDLGKKYQGTTILKEGEQVLMFAPYANADGKLAGVKVLDITAGLAADSVVATLDLEAPVAATAAATAVAVAAYDVNVTLVADGYIYPLTYTLPKPERTETTVLNPFAYNLSSTLSEDSTTLTVNYTLNANADAVEILILSGEEVVKTIPCKGINKGTYTVAVPTAGLPQKGELTWSVNVKGTSVAAPTQEAKIYSFYHPSGMDIDNNPENATFGMLLINEGMHSVKDIAEGYVSSGFGAGIFAFTPSLDLIPNGDQPGYNGGIEFTTGRADGSGTAYSPRRIRISEDGRIFVTSLNTDGNYLWEVNPANMNEWTSVFKGTLNEQAELLTADSAFVAAPNNGFDVKGAGENLKLAMYSVNLNGITAAAMGGFRLHEYNLGTATEWATAPSKALVEGKYAINYTGTQVEYDNEGGFWIASYRGTASDANPGLVHINADGVEDAKLIWSNVRQAGIRFNNDFTKLVVAGNNGAAKKATIYAISKDANGAPVLTEETVIDMAVVGSNLNDFAWDYAGNLYACGNSAEKLVGWALPYSGKVTTPAASKYAFNLEVAETTDPGITLTATGLETTLEEDGSYTLQGLAVVNGDESTTMDFMLCVYPTEGYTDAFLNGWSVMIFGAPTPGAFVENTDGTFTYTAQIEDTFGDGTVYNINMSGTIKKTEGPVYMEMEDQITNMVFDFDNMVMYGGPSTNYEVEVFLGLAEDNLDGTYTLSSESSVAIKGMDAEFIEGYAYDIDLSAPSAKAVVKVNWDGMYYAFTLTMTAAPVEALEIVIADATVEVEEWKDFPEAPTTNYALTMTADWTNPADNVVYPVKVELPIYDPNATEPVDALSMVKVGDGETLLGVVDGEYLKVSTVNSVVTATGLVSNPAAGFAVNITISGKLPETAVDNIQMGVKAVKVIKNGQLIIINNDVEYSAQGQLIK